MTGPLLAVMALLLALLVRERRQRRVLRGAYMRRTLLLQKQIALQSELLRLRLLRQALDDIEHGDGSFAPAPAFYRGRKVPPA